MAGEAEQVARVVHELVHVRVVAEDRGGTLIHADEVQDQQRQEVHDAGGGHGLVGMRERIGAWGGTVEAGNRAAGGFRVFASVPVTAAEGEEPSTEVGEHRHS